MQTPVPGRPRDARAPMVVPSLGVPSRSRAGVRLGPPWPAQHTGEHCWLSGSFSGGDGELGAGGGGAAQGGVGSKEAPLAQTQVHRQLPGFGDLVREQASGAK